MVKKSEIPQEAELFGDIWNLFKFLLPVGDRHDEAYWDSAVSVVNAVMRKYAGSQFATDLCLAVLGEAERRMKT